MRDDTIIIGGGLSGLVCGIKLQEAGRSCAIISAGQSALHFSSGAFDLLGVTADGTEVERPFDALKSLPAEHPYSKVGADGVEAYARALPQWFAQMGIVLNGDVERNSSRITPLGIVRKSWMMLDEYTPLADEAAIAGSRYLIVNFAGFLDFYPKFIADCLEQRGGKCRMEVLSMSAVEKLRINRDAFGQHSEGVSVAAPARQIGGTGQQQGFGRRDRGASGHFRIVRHVAGRVSAQSLPQQLDVCIAGSAVDIGHTGSATSTGAFCEAGWAILCRRHSEWRHTGRQSGDRHSHGESFRHPVPCR